MSGDSAALAPAAGYVKGKNHSDDGWTHSILRRNIYEWVVENVMQCNASPPQTRTQLGSRIEGHMKPSDSRFIIFPAASILLPRRSSACDLTRRCSRVELRRPASSGVKGSRTSSLHVCVCKGAATSAGSARTLQNRRDLLLSPVIVRYIFHRGSRRHIHMCRHANYLFGKYAFTVTLV